MKTTNRFFAAIAAMLLLFNTSIISAQEDQKRPMYITATTMYWNSDSEGTMDEWKAIEKEYMDKVTKKNEHIMGAQYYTHLLTPNSNEVIYVQSYSSWDAIEKANARNGELEKEAWPDEEARMSFLKKMNSAYADYHSDEIYETLPGAKHMEGEMTKDMIMYLRQNKRAYPKDVPEGEFMALRKKQLDVTKKNEYIKAYWPSMHAWGNDRRDFNEAILLDSLGDLDKMFDRNQELMKEVFTEEEGKAMGKYFKGHGDYIYTAVKL